jgi:hypothetical protein
MNRSAFVPLIALPAAGQDRGAVEIGTQQVTDDVCLLIGQGG